MENGFYIDVPVQKIHMKSEDKTLCELAKSSQISVPVILLVDRGYEAYSNFAYLEQKGLKYLIQLKDQHRTYAYGVMLPDQLEFDLPVRMTPGRLTRQQVKQQGIPVPKHYYCLLSNVVFDYLTHESDKLYAFTAQIVRLKLKDDSAEILITNMDQVQSPLAALSSLYARRWGIEISFRGLKHLMDLIHLHSRNPR